ncbi:type I 3-dehydroquinate dehydratase [Candidatus Bathyarchaeota archaeon]|nr:type I 3-dehydroquinate dehydratase [Candidatus Bathyarchaeota archaeon]
MTVKICATITGSTMREIVGMIKKAEKESADLIEIRIDYIQGKYSLHEVRKLSKLPLIATNRPLRENGFFTGSEEERIHNLLLAADSGFDFVDVELSTNDSGEIIKRMMDTGAKTIISSHIFGSTPHLLPLDRVLKKEMDTHANINKLVTFAKTFEDNLTILKFVEISSKKSNVVCFCMGELGMTSRLISPLIGGCFTYASIQKGKASAAGQLTLSEMRRFYSIFGA